MPWFVDKNNCVIAGTKDNPGEKVKCHDSRQKAIAHMQALFANVEDVKELIPDVLFTYKQGEQRRFVMIATIDTQDEDGETFGSEAQDFAVNDMIQTGEFPELRVFHVKGMKVGNVDKANRMGPFLVLEGTYDDTPQAKEIDRLVQDKQSNLKSVSIGFSVVEAAGTCPCGARLRVGPLGLRAFFKCPKCEQIQLGRDLTGVRFTKARIFDATITDRPAVKRTAIANFSIVKELDMALNRDELKERLVANGFDETLAETWLDSISDEDLERMKEDEMVEKFKEMLEQAAEQAKEETKRGGSPPDEEEEKPRMISFKGGMGKCPGCGARLKFGGRDDEERKEAFEVDLEPLAAMVKETVIAVLSEVQIDLPDVEKRFDAIEETLKEVKETVSKQVVEAAAEFLKGTSERTKSRLTFRSRTETKEQDNPESENDGEVMAGDGKSYQSISAMFDREE